MILLKHDWNSFLFEASETALARELGLVELIKVTFSQPGNFTLIGEDGREVRLDELSTSDRADLEEDLKRFTQAEKGDT